MAVPFTRRPTPWIDAPDPNNPPPESVVRAADVERWETLGQDVAAWSEAVPAEDVQGLAPVATTGAYADLTGKPSIPDSPDDIGAATAAQGAKADTAVQPGSLAPVATSGAYTDLTGRPALAPVATTGAYVDLTGKPAIPDSPDDIGAASAVHTHAASAVTSGLLDPARLGTGTRDGTKFLRDDQTWAGADTYTPYRMFRPNHWYGALYSAPGTTSHILGLLTAIPFFVPHTFRADRIACEVVTAVTGTEVRMSIHATSPTTDGPGTLLLGTAPVSAATTGVKEVIIDQTLAPGLYWLGAVSQAPSGTAPTLRTVGSGTQPPVPQASFVGSSASLGMSSWYMVGITGAVPDWTGGSYAALGFKVMVRVAA